MAKSIGLVAAAALLFGFSPVTAQAAPSSPELVIDVATGNVLHEDEATRQWFPASTTKMMTAYVALRSVRAGHIKLETPLIASARASAQPPSKIGIRPGQEITLDNALKILMVKSANDLAVVIAEGVGGSQDGFASMMNAEAARLGMRESHFVNPHGLFNAGQVSSARDLAILGRAMLTEFPEFRDYWGIGAVQLGSRVMKNTNGLIGRYPGAEGMKTGFICPSGFNVVALASRGGRTLLAVVLGAGSGAERTVRTAQILDKGFAGSAWAPVRGVVNALPASHFGAAPNMRNEICRKGRQIPLGEEEDSGAITYAAPASDSASVFAVMTPAPMPGASRAVGNSSQGGKVVLGPRADMPAIPVYLGRAPGSTEVARGPGKTGLPASAAAFAAAPKTRPGAGTASAAAGRTESESEAKAGSPLQLPGVFTQGPGAGAIGLRANVNPGSRPANPGAIQPKQRTAAVTPPKATKAPEKAAAKASGKDSKTAEAKAKAAAKAAPKAKAKAKAAAADDE